MNKKMIFILLLLSVSVAAVSAENVSADAGLTVSEEDVIQTADASVGDDIANTDVSVSGCDVIQTADASVCGDDTPQTANASLSDNNVKETDIATDESISSGIGANSNSMLSASDEETLGVYETFYFNANAAVDGDGSINSPFKYITNQRMTNGCTAYFADGVYEISENCEIMSNYEDTKVTFIGTSTEGTIFRCTANNTFAFSILDISRLYVSKITFDHAPIKNNGLLDATDCVFKNNDGVDIHSDYGYNNTYGAIYSPGSNYAGIGMKSELYLTNCLIYNNTATYGAAVYHKNGITKITNTRFIKNQASLYGGALATDGGTILLENCLFDDYKALGDSGGAIYAKVTNLTILNTNFTNGYTGFFGGAICNLESNLDIQNAIFYNNTARYDGGAIFKMYGNISLKNVNITKSSARDGGALFFDNCSSIVLNGVSLDQSTASRYGGSLFLNNGTVTASDFTIANSQAPIGNEVYSQERYEYDIGYNSDYEMMQYNSLYNGVLPSRYSLVEEGLATPVRDQMAGGNCWAFGPLAALESCILKATGKSMDLSEENIKNLIEKYSAYGWDYDTNNGGHSEMMWGNLISWLGPVLESDDPYDDYSTLSPLLDAIMHVQNVYYLPTRTNALDNDAIKRAILDYGAVSVTVYMDDDNPLVFDKTYNAHFYALSSKAYANHAVCIVGWDDNFDKSRFPMGDMADSNGAWIVKNSWGESWGDNGYFYVSYYDPVVYGVGLSNEAFTFILNDTVRYNRNYQYDIGGMTDYFISFDNEIYYKNTFTSIGNDILSAFSTMFEKPASYEASLYINGELKLTQRGSSNAGYYTIPFTQEFQLQTGDEFTISIKVEATNASFPIYEIVTASRLSYDPGVSFFSKDGRTWTDLYDYEYDWGEDIGHKYSSQVACIKAFTRSSSGSVLSSSVSVNDVTTNVGQSTRITANVKDENNRPVSSGYVIFDINGQSEAIRVSNGQASIDVAFDSIGNFTFNVRYDGREIYENSSSTFKVSVEKELENNEVLVQFVSSNDGSIKAIVTDSTGAFVSGVEVNLTVSNKTYTSTTNSQGVAEFTPDLSAGTYSASVDVAGKTVSNSTASVITILDNGGSGTGGQNGTDGQNGTGGQNGTIKGMVDVDVKSMDDGSLNVIVRDIYGNAVSGAEVKLIINSQTLVVTTDNDGIAIFKPQVPAGDYSVSIEVSSYKVLSYPATVTVNPASIVCSDLKRAEGSFYDFQARFLDSDGNPLANKEVLFVIEGNDYNVITNEYGFAKVTGLSKGTHQVTCVNPATGESVVKKATIIARIAGDKDVSMFYTESKTYKVRVFADNGSPAAAGETVMVNIDGVNAAYKTDASGYIKVNLASLTVKTHKIVVTYRGVKSTGTIKVKSILKAKNVKANKYKSLKLKVKTNKVNGKFLKGKKLTLKFKGKTYKAKINKKGVATFKFKKGTFKKLKVGKKYTYKVYYLKNNASKKIKIKK